MSTILIPVIDYGSRGVDSSASCSSSKIMVRELVGCQFNPISSVGNGLVRVLEHDLATGETNDISADIAKQAAGYIDANELAADGNVLRFLQDHGAVPEWVAAIEEGRFLAAAMAEAA